MKSIQICINVVFLIHNFCYRLTQSRHNNRARQNRQNNFQNIIYQVILRVPVHKNDNY